MRWLRSVAIVGLWGFMVAGSVYAVIDAKEAWPFAHYSMYVSAEKAETVTFPQVDGILADGSRRRLSIREELAPFDPSRLKAFVQRTGKGKKGVERQHEALERLLETYEQRRRAGLHSGPPLIGIELYDATWVLLPDASNKDQPTSRTLLARLVH